MLGQPGGLAPPNHGKRVTFVRHPYLIMCMLMAITDVIRIDQVHDTPVVWPSRP